MDGWVGGWTDELIDGWMDGWTDGQADRQIDSQKTVLPCFRTQTANHNVLSRFYPSVQVFTSTA